MPKVSVLMSIYQPDAGYLAEQLETIDAQTFDDFEVVVYNDCPADRSWEGFCREHCAEHPLRYVPGDTNRGYVKAFEHLVGLAEGEYIALCDQDDRWLPGRLAAGVAALDQGYVLACCDRQIIDGSGRVTVESWRTEHPEDASSNWQSGDHITDRAAFTCYSIGMATMIRTSVARDLIPFSSWVGHDKWLALGASELGACAFIEQPLVQYRRHENNKTGTLHGISCKEDWYRTRVEDSFGLAKDFTARFPNSPDAPSILSFAQARKERNIFGIWQNRRLAPEVSRFEIALRFIPDPLFKLLLPIVRREGN